MDYYEVDIICTGRKSDGSWKEFDYKKKIFDSPQEIIKFLKETYFNAKRSISYQKKNEPCGYCYEFNNCDWSHAPVEKWVQQDWVSVYKIHADVAFEEIKYETS